MLVFLVIVLNLNVFTVEAQWKLGLDEGETCRARGVNGKCDLPENCKHVNFREERPPICNFKGSTPVVCCRPPILRTAEKKCENFLKTCASKGKVRMRQADYPIYEKLSEINETEVFYPTIVGGEDAQARQYRGMVLLGYGRKKNEVEWNCGGSLITLRHVLTAAHCASSSHGVPKWARVGELDYSTDIDDAMPQERNVVDWKSHPDYKYPVSYNDIAVCFLDNFISITKWVAPFCLHVSNEIPAKKATVLGFGRTGFVSDVSTKLQEVNLTLISGQECRDLYGGEGEEATPKGIDVESMICASEVSGGKDACIGDSGGPMLISFPGKCLHTLIGITSFGKDCGRPNTPGVYTKIYHYLDWIEKTVWPPT